MAKVWLGLIGIIVLGFILGGVTGSIILVLLGVLTLGVLGMSTPKVVGLPWYEATGTTAAIRPYKTLELATLDANRAASRGWTIQSVTNSDGHMNVGRTVSGAVLTGGLSLLVGGSRSKGSVTVTFVRVPDLVKVAAVA